MIKNKKINILLFLILNIQPSLESVNFKTFKTITGFITATASAILATGKIVENEKKVGLQENNNSNQNRINQYQPTIHAQFNSLHRLYSIIKKEIENFEMCSNLILTNTGLLQEATLGQIGFLSESQNFSCTCESFVTSLQELFIDRLYLQLAKLNPTYFDSSKEKEEEKNNLFNAISDIITKQIIEKYLVICTYGNEKHEDIEKEINLLRKYVNTLRTEKLNIYNRPLLNNNKIEFIFNGNHITI